MLTVEGIQKTFGETVAIADLNLSVAPGTTLAILGPNGSGKSVAAQLLSGVTPPDRGDVWIGDASLATRPRKAKQQLGYVPEAPDLVPHLSGLEYLHLVGSLYGMSETRRRARINDLFAQFGLQGIGHTYAKHYSRANRQKFAFMAALLPEPTVLILDEPLTALDLTSRQTATGFIEAHIKRGGVTVLCTHDLWLASQLASSFLVLARGNVVAHNTLVALRQQAECAAAADLPMVYQALLERYATVANNI